MLKRGIFICCLLLCNFRIFDLDQISADSLRTILQQNHSPAQHKRLILTIRYYFRGRIGKDLASSKRQLANLLVSFPPMNGTAVRGFVETMYLMEQKNYNGAESVLIPTIRQASAADDHCLLYACFTHLGFIQTMRGKIADAVNSFRLSRREAIQLNDAYLQVLVDINISDIYYRNHMHTQSLHFLNEATHLLVQHQIDEPRFKMMIYANKTENFFTMGIVDSLALYSRRLAAQRFPNDRLYTYQQRSSYEVQLLLGQNKLVLSKIQKLRKDRLFQFDVSDEWNEMNARYRLGQLDTVRIKGEQLIGEPVLLDHPEISLPVYETLARVAIKSQQKDLAIQRLNEALQISKGQVMRLADVDTIAAQIRLDEMQSGYLLKEERFKREKLWLIFSLVLAALISITGAILYRSIRQKRRLEQILFESQKSELSYFNSHHLRRHVANILGIVDMIRHSALPYETYAEAEPHLFRATEDLDQSIREITAKLGD